MRIPMFLLSIAFLVWNCTTPAERGESNSETAEIQPPTLEEIWTSDTLLRTPESVLYDRARGMVYVANVNLNPWEKDGNGFLSKLDLRGNIQELEWVTGFNGPKGMGILDNSLFVADIDEIVEVDLTTSQIVRRYAVEGTPTLNDITVYNGVVYISGSDSNKVFELKDGEVTEILNGDLGRPNGLFAEPDRLLMITSNSSQLKSIDLASKQVSILVDSLGHGDGIVPAGQGDYLASSWRGELFHISADWQRTQLLDTRQAEINAADIDYVIDRNLLLVPTFFDNRVVAYRLVR